MPDALLPRTSQLIFILFIGNVMKVERFGDPEAFGFYLHRVPERKRKVESSI